MNPEKKNGHRGINLVTVNGMFEFYRRLGTYIKEIEKMGNLTNTGINRIHIFVFFFSLKMLHPNDMPYILEMEQRAFFSCLKRCKCEIFSIFEVFLILFHICCR